MEWREQSTVTHQDAYLEAQRWIEAVTKKTFKGKDFRSALENGVLLCDLINKIKPGVVKKVNRLPTPIAGLDNINVFLKACFKLGLKEAQLFHPGDLQDLSSRVTVKDQETNRRLKNALQELSGQKDVRDSGFGDNWYSEQSGGGGGGHRREDSLDSLDSLGSPPRSISSDATLKGSSEGCFSDAEADAAFKMADNKDSVSYRRSVVLTPKVTTQFNQFLPTKDKPTGYVPAPLRKKRADRNEDNRRSWTNPVYEDEAPITSDTRSSPDKSHSSPSAHQLWGYESGSDSDCDRPDPDLVLDDLASRRFHTPSPAPPANFAVPISPKGAGRGLPGTHWAIASVSPSVVSHQNVAYLSGGPGEEPRVERPSAVCTDSLFRELYDDSEDEDDEVGYADPVQDDLYARKMGARPQGAGGCAPYHKFLPKLWTPEDDIHIQKIRLGSQKRPWYKQMQGFSQEKSGSLSDDSESDASSPFVSCTPKHKIAVVVHGKRQRQSSDSFEGSKSTSDIPEESLVTRRPQYEELDKYREQIKQIEDQWQDDLSKWKNRRKSVNSDIVKKKEEREKVEQITYGSNRRSKTFKEMQEDRDNRRNSSIGSRIQALSFDDDMDVFEKPTPRSREILSRSYTIDTPFQSSDSFTPSQKEDNAPASSQTRVRSTKQESDTMDAPAETISSLSSIHRPKPSGVVSSLRSSVFENTSTAKTEETSSIVSALRAPQTVPAPKSPVHVQPPSFGSTYRQPQPSAVKANPPSVSRVSASLPRSYQRSDSARLTSVVAPRPFGTQASRVGSLTRSFTSDDSNNRINGDVGITVSKNSSVPSRYRQFMTPEDEAESQSSPAHSSEDEEEQEETTRKDVISTSNIVSDPVLVKKDVPAKDPSQESSCEMRISLNQKPNSSRDFGFEAAWDSTGARVKSVQPGSPAEMFQLQPGDEVLTVNGHRVADMSYLDWKAGMDEALREGSLVMDVRRYGQNSFPDTSAANTLDFTSLGEISPSAKTPTHSVVDVASNGVDGGFPKVSLITMTNDSEPLSLKNLKRRSEFFEQGGTDSATPEIPVPSITPSSRSWSWDPEEERRRQEKWQKEQERLLQEKYKRDQEKLQEEWLKAQQEISFSVAQQEPVSPHSPLPYSPWEEEEKKRKEVEQQRLAEESKRREEEEKKKRREEELERQIREEERKRREEELERQRLLAEERKRRDEELERQRLAEERKRRDEELERQRLAEERKRKEEELQRQIREEEERRRQREEELERQRREREEEERKRIEKEAEERRQREEEELLWQKRREQEREELRRRQAAAEEQQRLEKEQWAKSFDEAEQFQKKAVFVNPGGMVHWLLEEQARNSTDRLARSQRAVAELEMERRNILNVMRYREPERVRGGSLFDSKGPQPAPQAELQRQQLLDDMRKKTPVLTDSSWIRQRSATTPGREDLPSTRRGGSLDNLDNPHNSWRSSWTPRSDSHIPNYSRPHSALSVGTAVYGGGPQGGRSCSNTLPASLQGLSSGTAPWSRQLPSLSPSYLPPTTSPEPASDGGDPRQRSRSVSGKKVCTFCGTTLGKGAAMIIESLGLCYHLTCFKCFDCKSDLGGSEAGAEVRIRNKQLYCNSCYVRSKTGQPTSM